MNAMSAASSGPTVPRTLVIGCGCDIRGDDAVGRVVAESIAGWALPGVVVKSVHQLTPELAADVANSARVIFADASACCKYRARLERVSAIPAPGSGIGHAGDPSSLLALSESAFGGRSEAWLLSLPVATFEVGESLSAMARNGVAEGLRLAWQFLRRTGETPCTK